MNPILRHRPRPPHPHGGTTALVLTVLLLLALLVTFAILRPGLTRKLMPLIGVEVEEEFTPIRSMARIPDGTLVRANGQTVTVARFWMDRFEVSNADYERFEPSRRQERGTVSSNDNDPVVNVSWEAAMAYCDWRCVQERVPAGTYRLPTEDEWEYAARGGLVGRRYPWGNADPVRADIPRACFSGLSLTGTQSRTRQVGSFPPNGFGLYDMAGNVYEWCRDEWRGPVGTNAPASATGLAVQRAWRGGSWASKAPQLQCDARGGMSQMQWLDTIGFRCVRQ